MTNKTLNLTRAAVIAALYVVLTMIANAAGLARSNPDPDFGSTDHSSGLYLGSSSGAYDRLSAGESADRSGSLGHCIRSLCDLPGSARTLRPTGSGANPWLGPFSRFPIAVIPLSCRALCCNTHTEWKTDTSIWQRPLALEKLSAAV